MLSGSGPKPLTTTELHSDLVEQISQDRDKDAFQQLFEHFAPRIKSYLMIIGCDECLAEEITQDTLITLWRKAHLFDRRKSSVSTWLFRIARNRRIDLARKDNAQQLNTEDPTLFPTTLELDETKLDTIDRDKQVREALRMLSDEQRRLIRMSFFEAKAHGTIADELSLPLGTVKSRIRLAFGHLRSMLSNPINVDMD